MDPVLAVEDLTVTLTRPDGPVPVLERLSFSVEAGRTVALVGESGCGKSMTALAIMGLLPEGFARTDGRIRLAGEDIAAAQPSRLRALRGSALSMIFQEPMTALNPVYTVGDQIAEALRLHQRLGRRAALERALAMLRAVQIPAAERRLHAYPHELSGGMRQRVMIAMALACRPKLLIADEPTTALDVTVQAQVFDLLKALQDEMGTAIVLITHDLGAVADIADTVAVLYAGRCIEQGDTRSVMRAPQHPYTIGLMGCTPHLRLGAAADAGVGTLREIPGLVPPLGRRPAICAFADRCGRADATCLDKPQPPLAEAGPARAVACWHPEARAA
ncbi:ABC transporter ATP-binding protein [Methylobacterium sp. E-065]|uniref:ABC transporter ATP-binding protein n=1 Tax=Methylobacterium sp. E-065 TaxID=2836583 RepID=UPI001FBBF901|nr:ABC transporter ATP-binding protein [Methylobacterium sp. E-065]MCJ2021793.1 ABC transporter ATP-binding protein [Methylobacterium sp. E-065]